MKRKIIFIAFFILLSITLISLNFLQPSIGPHYGVVKEAGEYNIEMKSSFTSFYAYLLDKQNKSVSNKGIFCETKFDFTDGTFVNIPLSPYGEDGFSCELNKSKFFSCTINFNVSGKRISANFENFNPVVKKNN
jgi:hypothetical protein